MDKFLNVNVIDTLEKISGQYALRRCGLPKSSVEEILHTARFMPDGKINLLWTCEHAAIGVSDERDAFIQGSYLNRALESYLDLDLDFFWRTRLYGIEVTRVTGENVYGNIYEYDTLQYAQFAKRNTQPYTHLSLNFASGELLCIPRNEISPQKMEQLESEHGEIIRVCREVADESAIQNALVHQREQCEALPIRHLGSHLEKINEQLIQATAERTASRLQEIEKPNHPYTRTRVVGVPPVFANADRRSIEQLERKLQTMVDDPHLFVGPVIGERGLFVIASVQESRPSIKERLAVKPPSRSKSVSKSKKHEER